MKHLPGIIGTFVLIFTIILGLLCLSLNGVTPWGTKLLIAALMSFGVTGLVWMAVFAVGKATGACPDAVPEQNYRNVSRPCDDDCASK